MITYPTDKLQKVLLDGKCRQGVLPDDYTQVEYLESTGTQYINTGIIPTVANETEIRLTFARTSQSQFDGFGANANLNVINTTANWRLNGFQTNVSIVDNEFVDVILKQTSDGRYCKIKTTEGYGSIIEETNNFCLGKLYGQPAYGFKGKYKSCITLENGAIVQNLIPARRNSDNALGMYDTVTKTFLTNQGTGEFIAGPEVVYTTPTCEYGEPTTVSAKPTEVVRTQATDYAPVKSMKGNTVKWNQLINNNIDSWTIKSNATKELSADGSIHVVTTGAWSGVTQFNPTAGHKYFVLAKIDIISGVVGVFLGRYTVETFNTLGEKLLKKIHVGANTNKFEIQSKDANYNAEFYVHSVNVIDLTAIFGAGNEPTTVAAFETWLSTNVGLKDYYPYDAGSLLTVNTPSTVINGEEYPFPITTMKDINGTVMFPNGLCQVGSIKDEIDFEHGTAVKRVGTRAYDASTDTDATTDGTTTYYELATPIEYTLSVKGAVPTPDAPIDIWCNNGVLKVDNQGNIYTEGTQEVITDNLGNTANAERLLEVGDYKDTQSVLDGKVTRRIGIKVLDGTEDWVYVSANTPRFLTYINTINDLGLRLTPLYNTHFLCISDGRPFAQVPNNTIYTGGGTGGEIFIQSDNFGTTTATFKQWLADQYAAGTPVIIVYPISTPTTEQVTPQPLSGNTATITAGSIDNLPIESSNLAKLKKRYIGTAPVGRVYIGNNLIWETKEGYGVRWVHGDTSGAVERIGNMEYHRTLPIQSNMRRCIRKENGDIQYISDSDWTKDTNGNTIDYNAEGQDIMVEVPEHYYQAYQKVENGVTYDYLMLYPTVRFGKKVPKHYLGAFKAMLNRDTNKLYSTVKIDTNSLYDSNGDANGSSFTYPANASTYRGGDNDTTYDGTGKTLFGRPVSNISIATFCQYAKNRGNGYALKHWESHWCLWRLFVVEYATFNCQGTFTDTLTADGYHKGGLGFGLCSTTDVWSSYNNYKPIAPCGITLRLGSKTGVVKYTPAVQYSNNSYFEVPSYRGVENPFSDIWEITNGLYIVGADSKNYIMTADNGWYVKDFNYGSTSTPITGFTSRTANKNLGLVQGWPTDFIWDSHGDIIPTVINTSAANTADNTSPFRDYFWGGNTGAKRALLGGTLNVEVRAGLAALRVVDGVGGVGRSAGSRLLYMPSVSN